MDLLSWISLGIVALAIVAVPALAGMRGRLMAALEKERRGHADALAALERERRAGDDRVKSGRREALDEFLRELRVEERSRVRQANSMFSARRIIVHEERLCFREKPLSNWVEQETVVEDGVDDPPKPQSIFLPAQAGSVPKPGVNHNARVTSS